MNLRLVGIGAGVLVVLTLPLAGAIAGPVLGGRSGAAGESGLLSSLGLAEDGRLAEGGSAGDDARGGDRDPAPVRPDTRCGPELTSPDGVEAQTCVLSAAGETWARTYYRNTSGRALESVLTLMAPAGRTTRVHCEVEAGDEPGLCETPREATKGGRGDYSAVAEFAGTGAADALLLRAGSAPAPASNAASPKNG
ncbi:hypothetical protein ACN20G_11985 [Streptomyces sp. BI20]|uniref:hypothetical protein n=1 Tax=Streptomyces sp. BI20 TaxID=3403460 RepID=UPI003C7100EA